MVRARLGTIDLATIAVGGVLGAGARWFAGSLSSSTPSGGWFSYAPNTTFTVGTHMDGFTPLASTQTIETGGGLPIDTLAVNVCGSLLLGTLTFLLLSSTNIRRRLLVAAATGFCGSLTTFSTFAVEIAVLLRAKPIVLDQPAGLNARLERHVPTLVLYLVISIAGAAAAFWLGRLIAKRLLDTPGVSRIGGET